MHRNSFVNAPKHLNQFYQLKDYPNVFIAGQLSGVEGYVESVSSGLYSAINMANMLNSKPFAHFSNKTVIGALSEYIANANPNNFQPMNANWGIIKNDGSEKSKRAEIALSEIKEYLKGDNNGSI